MRFLQAGTKGGLILSPLDVPVATFDWNSHVFHLHLNDCFGKITVSICYEREREWRERERVVQTAEAFKSYSNTTDKNTVEVN